MAVFVAGILGIAVCYAIILGVGIWASMKASNQSEEEMILAGRKLGLTVGALTLIATWVGGGFVNGATEVMYKQGLVWAQVPVGYSIALLLGAIFFIKPMRDMQALTLIDPFQTKYGHRIGSLLFVPAILGDFFWVASILNALGSSLVVITDIDPVISVVISACFVAAYTSIGAMYSVTYTDVVQMFFILGGLLLSVPFTIANESVHMDKLNDMEWLGRINKEDIGIWIDTMLLLLLGGIPWQGYMQRVLAINSTRSAQILSTLSMFGCMLMAIPACLVGLVARTVDWESVPSFNRTLTAHDSSIMLPLVLRHLTPDWVAFFGLGAISAAVMSSADSSALAFSSTFTRNVYKNLFRPKASQQEIAWVLRVTIVAISGLSALIALTVPSIYYLAVLSSDLIYVILFPHLLLIIYWKDGVNSYGCVASFFLGVFIRVLGGEPGLGIPALILYPGYDPERDLQLFPHRTLAMLLVLFTHIIVSWGTEQLFKKGYFPPHKDVFQAFPHLKQLDVDQLTSNDLLLSEKKDVKR